MELVNIIPSNAKVHKKVHKKQGENRRQLDYCFIGTLIMLTQTALWKIYVVAPGQM